jgi:hypothetical protein
MLFERVKLAEGTLVVKCLHVASRPDNREVMSAVDVVLSMTAVPIQPHVGPLRQNGTPPWAAHKHTRPHSRIESSRRPYGMGQSIWVWQLQVRQK